MIPNCPEAGVKAIVRLAPEPPNVMPVLGSNVVLDEVADTVREAAAVCASPMVKGIAPVEVLEVISRFKTSEMVGAVFAPPLIVKFALETSK